MQAHDYDGWKLGTPPGYENDETERSKYEAPYPQCAHNPRPGNADTRCAARATVKLGMYRLCERHAALERGVKPPVRVDPGQPVDTARRAG